MSSTDTIYGWDTSSHDSTPTSRDGIDFFTCKLTDGDHYYENPTFTVKMTAMKNFGVEVLGAYHVLWGNASIANQAAWYIQMLDTRIPWWRDFEYFICQSDDEPFYTGVQTAPSIAQINEFHDRIQTVSNGKITAKKNSAYAPGWVYGNAISGLTYSWWQSNYGANPAGPYRSIYPGNTSGRWNGAASPIFLQYGSNAVIAGQTTSDANAFRGTLADLKAALGGTMTAPITPQQLTDAVKMAMYQLVDQINHPATPTDRNLRNDVWAIQLTADGFASTQGDTPVAGVLKQRLDSIDTALADIQAKLAALTPSGNAVTIAEVDARIAGSTLTPPAVTGNGS